MKIIRNGVEKMKSELELQQGEETARKDWCVDEIHAVEKKIDINARLVADLNEHIERIEYLLTEGKEELKHLLHDLEDAQIEVQKGSNDRRKANTQYQKTVMDQKQTKMLLQKPWQFSESSMIERRRLLCCAQLLRLMPPNCRLLHPR